MFIWSTACEEASGQEGWLKPCMKQQRNFCLLCCQISVGRRGLERWDQSIANNSHVTLLSFAFPAKGVTAVLSHPYPRPRGLLQDSEQACSSARDSSHSPASLVHALLLQGLAECMSSLSRVDWHVLRMSEEVSTLSSATNALTLVSEG